MPSGNLEPGRVRKFYVFKQPESNANFGKYHKDVEAEYYGLSKEEDIVSH